MASREEQNRSYLSKFIDPNTGQLLPPQAISGLHSVPGRYNQYKRMAAEQQPASSKPNQLWEDVLPREKSEYSLKEQMAREDASRFGLNTNDPYWREKLDTARWSDHAKSKGMSRFFVDAQNKREARARAKTGVNENAWNQLNAANAQPTRVSSNEPTADTFRQSILPKEQQDWYKARQKKIANDTAAATVQGQPQVANPNASTFAQAITNSTGIEPVYPDESRKTLDYLSSQGFNPRKNNPNMTADEQYREFFDNVNRRSPANPVQQSPANPVQQSPVSNRQESLNVPMELPPQRTSANAQAVVPEATANMSTMQALDNMGLIPQDAPAPEPQDAPGIYSGAGTMSKFTTPSMYGDKTLTNKLSEKEQDAINNKAAFGRMYPDYKPDNAWKTQRSTAQSRAYNRAGMVDPDNIRRHNMERASQGFIDMDDPQELKRMGLRTPSNNRNTNSITNSNTNSNTISNVRKPYGGPLPRSDYRGKANPVGLGSPRPIDKSLANMDSPSKLQKNYPNAGVSQYTSVQKKKPVRDGFIDEYMKDSMGL